MKTCQRKGCFLEGHWMPVLKVWAPERRGEPAELAINLRVCEIHRRTASIDDYLCDRGWEQIIKAFRRAGAAEPDRRLVQLEFRPYGGRYQLEPTR